MTQFILVRHGQTVANVEGRWTGWGQTDLTELGRAQVRAVAQRLAAEVRDGVALYTSPLPRALETAEGIGRALGLQPVPVDGLREINFGAMDGITLEEMEAHHPALYENWQDKANSDFTWPGGERRADFFRRVAAACDEILSRHPRGTVIIVGHGGTLRSCLAHLLSAQPGQWWTYRVGNCGVTRVIVEGGTVRLASLNDTAHLPEEQE